MKRKNWITELPEAREAIAELSPIEREKVARILVALGRRAEQTAQLQWRRRKAPLAEYWFAKGVDFRHLARVLRAAPAPVLL